VGFINGESEAWSKNKFAQLEHKFPEGRSHHCLFFTPKVLSQAQAAQRSVIFARCAIM